VESPLITKTMQRLVNSNFVEEFDGTALLTAVEAAARLVADG
jgi:hypothetical protein